MAAKINDVMKTTTENIMSYEEKEKKEEKKS